MPAKVEVGVRPSCLHPHMQMRAHYLVREEGMSLDDGRDELHNMKGPSLPRSIPSPVPLLRLRLLMLLLLLRLVLLRLLLLLLLLILLLQ